MSKPIPDIGMKLAVSIHAIETEPSAMCALCQVMDMYEGEYGLTERQLARIANWFYSKYTEKEETNK